MNRKILILIKIYQNLTLAVHFICRIRLDANGAL